MNLEIGKRPSMTENRYVIHLHDGTILNYFVAYDSVKAGVMFQLSDYCEDQLAVLAASLDNIDKPVKVFDANGVLLTDSKLLKEVRIHTLHSGTIYLTLGEQMRKTYA